MKGHHPTIQVKVHFIWDTIRDNDVQRSTTNRAVDVETSVEQPSDDGTVTVTGGQMERRLGADVDDS